MLSKSIYVKSVTNLSDARYCAGMGVEFLGVCIDEGEENYLPVAEFTEIKNWLVGVKWIAESNLTDSAEIRTLLKAYGLNKMAVSDEAILDTLRADNIDLLQRIDFNDFASHPKNGIFIVYVPDEKIDDFIKLQAANLSNCYLESDFTHETLQKLHELAGLKGVVLTGGKEDRPGFKNMDELIDNIELFETD